MKLSFAAFLLSISAVPRSSEALSSSSYLDNLSSFQQPFFARQNPSPEPQQADVANSNADIFGGNWESTPDAKANGDDGGDSNGFDAFFANFGSNGSANGAETAHHVNAADGGSGFAESMTSVAAEPASPVPIATATTYEYSATDSTDSTIDDQFFAQASTDGQAPGFNEMNGIINMDGVSGEVTPEVATAQDLSHMSNQERIETMQQAARAAAAAAAVATDASFTHVQPFPPVNGDAVAPVNGFSDAELTPAAELTSGVAASAAVEAPSSWTATPAPTVATETATEMTTEEVESSPRSYRAPYGWAQTVENRPQYPVQNIPNTIDTAASTSATRSVTEDSRGGSSSNTQFRKTYTTTKWNPGSVRSKMKEAAAAAAAAGNSAMQGNEPELRSSTKTSEHPGVNQMAGYLGNWKAKFQKEAAKRAQTKNQVEDSIAYRMSKENANSVTTDGGPTSEESATDTIVVNGTPPNDNKSPDEDEDDGSSSKSSGTNGDASSVQNEGPTLTERMLLKVPTQNQVGGAGGVSTLDAFRRAEANWAKLKASKPFTYDSKLLRWEQNGKPPATQFVSSDGAFGNPMCWKKLSEQKGKELDFDVVVCGGTLGIFFAMMLLQQGHRVCVLEAGKLRGREQEWNISMDELEELKQLGILTQEDIDAVITTEFPACRSGFKTEEVTPLAGGYFDNGVGYECETPGVLNLGISPSTLLNIVSERFKAGGGVIREQSRLKGVCVSPLAGTALDLGEEKEPITSRLVLDAMGNASPISAQQRYGMKPDGICAVVGSCAGGYDPETNKIGDIIYTNQNIVRTTDDSCNQYFWEAFPVGIGRNGKTKSDVKTTYMFTYMDADESRPSLETLMEDYWRLLPTYQPSINDPETDLDIKRILFAFFPTYRDSPLQPEWSRVLAVGDSSGIQSPLSFGGFGALTRHLDRVGAALDEALTNDCLHKDELGQINAYMPNLSVTWMFQKAMSVRAGQTNVRPEFINRLLATNFKEMDEMGQRTIKPFLQDVVRFDGLVGSLAKSFVADPTFMPEIVATVGLPTLADWLGHLSMMGAYTVLDSTVPPLLTPYVNKVMTDPRQKFTWRRRMDAWKFGSGMDYELPKSNNKIYEKEE